MGTQRILDITPDDVHQRVPLFPSFTTNPFSMTADPFLDAQPTLRPAPSVAVDEMSLSETWSLTFPGFTSATFGILDRLRETPHIDQYKKEKPGVTDDLKDPFRQYRDDIVVNWVLPSRLDLETERHVFSRLLKNDFGAGGCHDNLWMSFYRPETKRLKDVQVSHSISPDGFDIGIYVGSYATDLLDRAVERIRHAPDTFLDLTNPLLEQEEWRFYAHGGSGEGKWKTTWRDPLSSVPDAVDQANGIWVRRRISREKVLELQSDLVREGLDAVLDVWPIYRFYLSDQTPRAR